MSAATDEYLLALGRYLFNSGYHYTAVTPATHEFNNARAANRRAADMRDIFGWSRPFERATLSDEEFELMHHAEVLLPHGQVWRSALRWSSLSGLLFAHSAYPTEADDSVFFGPDTYRFASFIEAYLQGTDEPLARAVDIGCGSGAGAILVARAWPEAEVLGVDINPQALRLTAINAKLAGTANVKAMHSNLLGDVEGDFDLIIANPPYMMDTQERAYRHGGGELGAGLSFQIVESALKRLAPGGTLLLYTGIAIVNGHDGFLQALRERLNNERCSWHYREIDPDVFGEELIKPVYAEVERIAAVGLTLVRDS
ncbi:class I SAM-dependent methyltransferase [Allohahella marinimesophila]|uniref:Class I SAM-dependent methyltransferase n=1 Tax=Allohahella marinimesophila TaxID=1054972 RepID=A0ABP7Q269_9GAMM